jgi:cysteinyl-tRNA synthetase
MNIYYQKVLLLFRSDMDRYSLGVMDFKLCKQKYDEHVKLFNITTYKNDMVVNIVNRRKQNLPKCHQMLLDDFNFAEGLAILFELAKDLRKAGNLLLHQNKKETPDLTSNAFESNAFEKVTFRFTVPLEQRHPKKTAK